MTSRRETFTAAPESTTASVEYPDVVAAFEELGFSRLGRLSRVAQDEVWRWAATYPRARRDEFIAHLSVPPVVLRAPDGSAFVTVGWWWGMPDVRLRTALSNGSVVETVRQWDQVPVPPRAHGRIYRLGDLQQEQLLLNTPAGGRDVALAQGAPADLWRAHQDHVTTATTGGPRSPLDHTTMAEAVALSNRLARHQQACHRAAKRRGFLILGTVAMVGIVAVTAILTLSWRGLLFVLAAEILAIALMLFFRHAIFAAGLRVRYRASSRPPLEP